MADIALENKPIVSENFLNIGLFLGSVGFIHGVYDEAEVPLPSNFIDLFAFYGPSVLSGLAGIIDGVSLALRGKQAVGNFPLCNEDHIRYIGNPGKSRLVKSLSGGFVGCLGEAGGGTIENIIGYGAGRLLTKAAKFVIKYVS